MSSLTIKNRRSSISARRTTIDAGSGSLYYTPAPPIAENVETPPRTADSSSNKNSPMARLAKNFQKRNAEKRQQNDPWSNLVKNALTSLQRGKIPLLLAVEAGNQSMCRELLSAQTAEQLKVSFNALIVSFCTYVLFYVQQMNNE